MPTRDKSKAARKRRRRGNKVSPLLEGGRLKRLLDTVEKATESIPPAAPQDPPQSDDAEDSSPAPESSSPGSPAQSGTDPIAANPWSGLLETGLSMLQQLAAASRPTASNAPVFASSGLALVHRDERTGESYLKFPMPNLEVLDQVLTAVGALLERFRK